MSLVFENLLRKTLYVIKTKAAKTRISKNILLLRFNEISEEPKTRTVSEIYTLCPKLRRAIKRVNNNKYK